MLTSCWILVKSQSERLEEHHLTVSSLVGSVFAMATMTKKDEAGPTRHRVSVGHQSPFLSLSLSVSRIKMTSSS